MKRHFGMVEAPRTGTLADCPQRRPYRRPRRAEARAYRYRLPPLPVLDPRPIVDPRDVVTADKNKQVLTRHLHLSTDSAGVHRGSAADASAARNSRGPVGGATGQRQADGPLQREQGDADA